MLHMLLSSAEWERDSIRGRTQAGVDRVALATTTGQTQASPKHTRLERTAKETPLVGQTLERLPHQVAVSYRRGLKAGY